MTTGSRTRILHYHTQSDADVKAATVYLLRELTQGFLRFEWEAIKAQPVSYHLRLYTKEREGEWLDMLTTILGEPS